MSTAPAAAAKLAGPEHHREIVVVSHSSLFYWWPVWALGYVMAAITLMDHQLMATVPSNSKIVDRASGTVDIGDNAGKITLNKQDIIVSPEDTKNQRFELTKVQVTTNKSLGVVFAIALLLVITITNVPLRGLWSVIVIVVIILVSIILALTHTWEKIFAALSWLDIRINFGGYVFIATGLLIVWLIVFFFFDRQIYMIFTPGSLRVQLEIGDGETTYDTTGMTIQKQRSDLFRHWILGLGSGDLIVKTAGAQAHHFDLPNVLALGRRVREIEDLLRTKMVVAAPPE